MRMLYCPLMMRWQLHGLTVEGRWSAPEIGARWSATFAPLAPSAAAPDLTFELSLAQQVPPAPAAPPDFRQGELLAYYLDGPQAVAHFPRYGQLTLDLARGATHGVITLAALATYGVFEDLLAIGLSPHLRRRGHILAARLGRRARAGPARPCCWPATLAPARPPPACPCCTPAGSCSRTIRPS